MKKRCIDCKYYKVMGYCEKFDCDAGDNGFCRDFEVAIKQKPTVFDQITASQEVLADKLVYCVVYPDGNAVWCSAILEFEVFDSRTEALSATLARLMEVCDE